jgi:hypothetical protein
MSQRLWFGAAAILITAAVGKQMVFSHVTTSVIENRRKEHVMASNALKETYQSAKAFELPPLSEADGAKIRDICLRELKEIEKEWDS